MMQELCRMPALYARKYKDGPMKMWQVAVMRDPTAGAVVLQVEQWKEGGPVGVKILDGSPYDAAFARRNAEELRWAQMERGYVDDPSRLEEKVLRPMLGMPIKKGLDEATYPCEVQHRLGEFCMLRFNGARGRADAFSAKGVAFPHLDHIRAEANSILRACPGAWLIGSLYGSGMGTPDLQRLVRSSLVEGPAQEDMLRVKYVTNDYYSLQDPDMVYPKRRELLAQTVLAMQLSHIYISLSHRALNATDAKVELAQARAEKCDGIWLYSPDGTYCPGKKSGDLRWL